MPGDTDARYAFDTEWYDEVACLKRHFSLLYFESDGSVEMIDSKTRRTFLKRCVCPGVTLSDLHVGSTVTVYARQLKVLGYADAVTGRRFEPVSERTVAFVTTEARALLGEALELAAAASLAVSELRVLSLSPSQASSLFPHDSRAAARACAGPLVAIELKGARAVSAWRAAIAGRAGAEGSADGAEAAAQAKLLFGGSAPLARCDPRGGLLLVKPHAVREGRLGGIVRDVVAAGFELVAGRSAALSRVNASEFLEVYQGVSPEAREWAEELSQGGCVALQLVLTAEPQRSVAALRELCGAHDPAVAERIHPKSLRARYGEDKVRNGVHCTDLPEDAPLEAEYFFSLLP
uniref:DM10 domain-containing protein n=1 Tax=Emiliania huxleyi TaxID=2903 RepID=A0A7S3WSU5_EMIHU